VSGSPVVPARTSPSSSVASASAFSALVPSSVTELPPLRARVAMPRAMLPVPMMVMSTSSSSIGSCMCKLRASGASRPWRDRADPWTFARPVARRARIGVEPHPAGEVAAPAVGDFRKRGHLQPRMGT